MAQSHLDTLSGSQRIAEGLALLRQAWRDAITGVGLVLSGIGLMLAGALTSAWTLAGDILHRVPGAGRAARWASQRIAAGFRWLTTALTSWMEEDGPALLSVVMRTIFWLLATAAVVFVVIWSIPQFDWMAAPAQFLAAIPALLIVAVAVGVVVLFVLVFGRLLDWVFSLFTPGVLRVLFVGFGIAAACAVVTLVATMISPPPLLAWIAIAALFAGAAGVAVVSFGPTRFAAISLGGRRERQVYADTPNVIDAAFERADNAAELPQATRALDDRHTASAPVMRSGTPAFRPPSSRFIISAAVGLALAVLGVLSALWFRSPNGTAQVQTLWAALQPATAASNTTPPALPRIATTAPLADQRPLAGNIVSLIADGRPGDVYWRSGYRGLTARMDDSVPVQSLTLPPAACGAAAILVFGSASSDGAPELNQRLARHRALWAADWARAQLATCSAPTSARTVIAVSLGQAAGVASNDQRRIRLIALGHDADMRPERLRQSLSSLIDMQAFTTFEACARSELQTTAPATSWCR
jgi:hypothetical protein